MARLTKKVRDHLAVHLGAQSHERLVELVVELAEGDVELRNRLLLEAASGGSGPVDALAELLQQVHKRTDDEVPPIPIEVESWFPRSTEAAIEHRLSDQS